MSKGITTDRGHIADRLGDAIFLIQNNRTTAAIAMIVISIDTIAQYEYPDVPKSYDRYILFLNDCIHMVTLMVTGGIGISGDFKFAGLELKGIKHDAEGMVSFQDLIYSFLRCNVIHEGKINHQFVLEESTHLFEQEKGLIKMPPSIVNALLIAAITSPSNIGIDLGSQMINFGPNNRTLPIRKIAGKRKAVHRLIRATINKGLRERNSHR